MTVQWTALETCQVCSNSAIGALSIKETDLITGKQRKLLQIPAAAHGTMGYARKSF